MHDNDNFNNSQDNRYTSQRIRIDGLMLLTERKTDISVYLPKTPYNQRKPKVPKGFNGISRQQQQNIELSVYVLCNEYGLHNCKWLTLTFDEDTSDEALVNLLDNFNLLDKAIKYRLKTVYKTIDVKPYIIVYGFRERVSYNRGIPCLDVNILCAVKDKNGNQLFNESALIEQIYLAASNQAKETIQIPKGCFSTIPYNTLDDYKRLANYLKKQVDLDLLKRFQQSQHASRLPSTYVHVAESLKKTFTNIKTKYQGSKISDHNKILQNSFSDNVTIKEKVDYKLIAQLNDVSPESINTFDDAYQQKYYLRHPDRFTLDNPSYNLSDNTLDEA